MKFNFSEIQKSEHFLLIAEFFIYFSRFEYAMKRGGYGSLKGNGILQYFDADWNKLTSELLKNNIFSSYIANNNSFEIISIPPKRMIDKDNFEINSSSRNIIDSIKIVRNNLFHGGKFYGSPNEMKSERNLKLIKESLETLKFIIEDKNLKFQDCNDLRSHFNEYI